MEGKIFLRQSDNTLLEMTEQPYAAEELLQQLLASHPDLLAGDQIDSVVPRRWLFIGQEVGVPGEQDGGNWWSLDHLFLDQDAIPTFVEVKRSTDTRSRREVVAQMLDYAANATEYWPVPRMREDHARMCQTAGVTTEEHFAQSFGPESSLEMEDFWHQAEVNLREGRVRLLFVGDKIPLQLRRIVEFLNRQMDPAQVLALEVRQFVSPGGAEGLQTLVPRIIGQSEITRKATSAARVTGERMPEISPEELMEKLPESVQGGLSNFLNRARELGWQTRPKSFPKSQTAEFFPDDVSKALFSITSDGYFWINTAGQASIESLSEYDRDEFNSIVTAIDRSKKPETQSMIGIYFKHLQSEANQARLLRLLEIVDQAAKEGYPANSG